MGGGIVFETSAPSALASTHQPRMCRNSRSQPKITWSQVTWLKNAYVVAGSQNIKQKKKTVTISRLSSHAFPLEMIGPGIASHLNSRPPK